MSSTDIHLSFLPLSHVFERMAGQLDLIPEQAAMGAPPKLLPWMQTRNSAQVANQSVSNNGSALNPFRLLWQRVANSI